MHKAAPRVFRLDDFTIGWDNISASTALDKRSLADCKNLNLNPLKGLEKRGGMQKLYSTSPATAPVKSLYEYKAPNGTNYVLVTLADKVVTYITDQWVTLKSGLTSGKKFTFVTHQGFCYCANGADDNFKLYNTTASNVGIAPPSSAPTVAEGSAGDLSGKYKYVYCYKRTTPNAFIGNPSPESSEITVSSKQINVTVAASSDPQVDKIVIYRTLNLNAGGDPTQFYKVAEISNSGQVYSDNIPDSQLSVLCETDNDVPPKAMILVLHKDRIFYVNCPDKEWGKSLVMWSKAGIGEAVPATNYQYFDRDDGEEITGAASLGDYFVVFKKNKISVLAGEFEALETIFLGIGCIAPWAILSFEDKIIFLSEEGWKMFDGQNIYPISKRINGLVTSGYTTIAEKENYSVAYYPEKHHFQFLINHSQRGQIIPVGHFIIPLFYFEGRVPEAQTDNIVSWTYHQYDNHTLTCLGNYTDQDGITRVIAGDNNGYVYQLDSGTDDDGYNIAYKLQTGWLDFDVPYTKTIRRAYISYLTDKEDSLAFKIEVDFLPYILTEELKGTDSSYCGSCYCGYAYCAIDGSLIERVDLCGTGEVFRYNFIGDNKQALTILKIDTHFRIEGLR